MATITGLTAERMLEIEGASIVSGEIVDGNLILTKHNGTQIDAGPIPPGPAGPPGPTNVGIPGEVKLWPSDTLPNPATYGKWVWADGAYYDQDLYPIAFAHLRDQWDLIDASDPGDNNFRVPDLRGLVPAGMDAMPGGTRKNRMTRGDAIIFAKRTGKETHKLDYTEMTRHSHTGYVVNSGAHYHTMPVPPVTNVYTPGWSANWLGSLQGGSPLLGDDANRNVYQLARSGDIGDHSHQIALEGNDIPHETVQPTIMVPYIVCLDG